MSVHATLPNAATLAVTRYPATVPSQAVPEPIILLHGWGCDSRSWVPLLPGLQALGEVWTLDLPGFGSSDCLPDYALPHVLALIETVLPPRATLVGWSLGGMLAVALAQQRPERVSRVITLATNACFVARPDWPQAMAPVVNRQFLRAFSADAGATLQQFAGLLAKGDDAERPLLKRLRPLFKDASLTNSQWLQSLELLARLDNREAFAQLQQPGLHLLAEADVLVPASAASALQILNPVQQVALIPGAAHALHWSQPEQVVQRITDFLRPEPLDKRRVAQSFSRAAHSYDSVAVLQRRVGEHLLGFCPALPPEAVVLDLGCGTGFFTEHLSRRYPGAQLIGLDIAQGMLAFARQSRPVEAFWLGGDAESLPLADASVDLIYTSLAIQWCSDLPGLFKELQRVLKPGGSLLFSTLGPGTLHELRAAWQQVDHYVHVNRFPAQEAVLGALHNASFVTAHWEEQAQVLRYARLQQLTRELKSLGAHNINQGQSEGLTGRRKLEALKAAYETWRQADGLLPASYQVFYGVLHASR